MPNGAFFRQDVDVNGPEQCQDLRLVFGQTFWISHLFAVAGIRGTGSSTGGPVFRE